MQHLFSSLDDRGKMAMVIGTGAVSRGSANQGSNREWDVRKARKAFVERDLIEIEGLSRVIRVDGAVRSNYILYWERLGVFYYSKMCYNWEAEKPSGS